FLVDNSEPHYAPKLKSTLIILARIVFRYHSCKIILRFLCSSETYQDLHDIEEVSSHFDRHFPTGSHETKESTYLSGCLDNILSDYMINFKENRGIKPLNLLVLTPGDVSKHDDFEHTVRHWAEVLDKYTAPRTQVGVQFVLIGHQQAHWHRFHALDDDAQGHRDIVDSQPFDPENEAHDTLEIHLKIMLGAINKNLDRQELTPDLSSSSEFSHSLSRDSTLIGRRLSDTSTVS
ncbi:hypothetical protein EDC01DRAFT_622332, partial [Geopyxis carbonaria]